MRQYTPAQYKKAAVIVHGKSERLLASYIYTNLHLPVRIIDSKVFPINQDPFSNDTLEQIQILSKKLQEVKETNLLEYVNYCLSLINQV